VVHRSIDKEERWKGKAGKHLGVVMGDQRRHQKYRAQKAKAAWEVIRRINKLPEWGKRKIVTQQILSILTYGWEVYHIPSKQQRRLATEIQRWVVGAYRGSNANKVEQLTGITELRRLMQNERVRWATSVYGQHLPDLREVAEPILREWIEADSQLRWMDGCLENRAVRVEDLEMDRVEEWSDGSRMEGRAAGATRTAVMYLGTMTTIADAEAWGYPWRGRYVTRLGGDRQPRSNTAHIWIDNTGTAVMGRRATGTTDGGRTGSPDVGERTQWGSGERRSGC